MDRDPPAWIGTRYLIEEQIGRGVSGTVFRASVPGTESVVAVKVLHPHLTERTVVVDRFLREREVLARLRHPNVVAMLGVVAEAGTLAIVMELVAGGDLRQHLRRGPLPPADACALLAQVAGALHAAHAAGVIHRDVKPENVLVDLSDTGRLTARLTDFGIARLVDRPGLTGDGGVLGTPAYLAPEVVSGGPASPAADVYALGVLGHELLCGRRPVPTELPSGRRRGESGVAAATSAPGGASRHRRLPTCGTGEASRRRGPCQLTHRPGPHAGRAAPTGW